MNGPDGVKQGSKRVPPMSYYDITRRAVTLNGESISLCVKAGMVPWEEMAASALLLSQEADVQEGMRVLSLENGAGALAVWAAQRGAEVHAYDHSLVAARMARATAEANGVGGVTVYDSAYPDRALDNSFDLALLIIPKGRTYARVLLVAAYWALKPGGRLYFAGPNASGIKPIVADAAAVFGLATTIRYKARCRVALAVKGADMENHMPRVSPDHPDWSGEPQPFDAWRLRLFGAPGVFSAGEVDLGTAMLLHTLDSSLCSGARVLDVGCGCGVIGLYAAALGAQADLIDSNWPALACAQRAIAVNRIESARVWASDIYSDVGDAPYDLILSNPPFHAGQGVDVEAAEELIVGAWERLSPGGRLRLVANRFLPYDRAMQPVFGANRVSVVTQDRRYRVLEGRR